MLMLGKGPGQNCWSRNNNNNSNNSNTNDMLSLPRVFIAVVVQSYRLAWSQYCHFVTLSRERRGRQYLSPAPGCPISLVSSSGLQLKGRDLQGRGNTDDCVYTCRRIHVYVHVHVCVFISARKRRLILGSLAVPFGSILYLGLL